MDMEKIMAYVEKIAENLEGLVCAIGCDSMPSDGAIYVDGEQKVNYISTREALRILDGFGNNSASVMIGKSDYILIYDASRKLIRNSSSHSIAGRSRWLVGSSRRRMSGLPNSACARRTLTFWLPVRSAIWE